MTPEALESLIDDAFQRELDAIKDGSACTTPDGKPASTMKERTELLKAACEHLDRKRPKGADSPQWGKALSANGGGA